MVACRPLPRRFLERVGQDRGDGEPLRGALPLGPFEDRRLPRIGDGVDVLRLREFPLFVGREPMIFACADSGDGLSPKLVALALDLREVDLANVDRPVPVSSTRN